MRSERPTASANKTQAAARGQVGTLRLAYTLATVYETLPALIAAAAAEQPELNVRTREIFAEDLERLLNNERVDVALAPMSAARSGLDQHPVRQEPFVAAVALEPSTRRAAEHFGSCARGADDRALARLHGARRRRSRCRCRRDAGFEPILDEQAAGSMVWGNIAGGHGVGLVVGSLRYQLPRGITLIPLAAPTPTLAIDLVWPAARTTPAVTRLVVIADGLARARGWLAS